MSKPNIKFYKDKPQKISQMINNDTDMPQTPRRVKQVILGNRNATKPLYSTIKHKTTKAVKHRC